MKLETFSKTIVIVAAVFILGLVLLGDGFLQSEYATEAAPQFVYVNESFEAGQSLAGEFDDSVFTLEDPGQTNRDDENEDLGFWTYTIQSLESAFASTSMVGPSIAATGEVGNFLGVNPIILGALISVIILSGGYALIAFWKGKKP